MDGNLLPDGNVSIPFEKTNGVYVLRDAIVLSADYAVAISQDEFDSMAQARFDNWIAHLEAEPLPAPDIDASELFPILPKPDPLPEPEPPPVFDDGQYDIIRVIPQE